MRIHRKPDQREKDLVDIARLYLQGQNQTSIAAVIGVTQQTVSADLKLIRKRWRESSLKDFDEAIAQEIAKIDLVEAEYWQQWDKSKLPRHTRKTEKCSQGAKTTAIEEPGLCNPQYLNGVMNCIDRRCRLLGLDSELKYQDLTVAIGRVVQAGFVVEQTPRADLSGVNAQL